MEQIKAWVVTDLVNLKGVTVFHTDRKKAEAEGAIALEADLEDIDSFHDETLDRYAVEGFVPLKVLYEKGWKTRCMTCSIVLAEKNRTKPVFIEQKAYCGPSCYLYAKTKELRQ